MLVLQVKAHLKLSLKRGVKSGALKQVKGVGAFKLGEKAKKKTAEKKPRKPKAKKATAAGASAAKKAVKKKSPAKPSPSFISENSFLKFEKKVENS